MCGDFNHYVKSDIPIIFNKNNKIILSPINNNGTPTCKLPWEKNFTKICDNILISNNLSVNKIEYLHDSNGYLLPKNKNNKYTDYTSDHQPISVNISSNIIVKM